MTLCLAVNEAPDDDGRKSQSPQPPIKKKKREKARRICYLSMLSRDEIARWNSKVDEPQPEYPLKQTSYRTGHRPVTTMVIVMLDARGNRAKYQAACGSGCIKSTSGTSICMQRRANPSRPAGFISAELQK